MNYRRVILSSLVLYACFLGVFLRCYDNCRECRAQAAGRSVGLEVEILQLKYHVGKFKELLPIAPHASIQAALQQQIETMLQQIDNMEAEVPSVEIMRTIPWWKCW